jgi:hypothetical protein
MIKRKETPKPAVFLLSIEERRETHEGCPFCLGRRLVRGVYNGKVVARPCEYYGLGGRARPKGEHYEAIRAWPEGVGGSW